MPQRRTRVTSAEGLHARPAALFVRAATGSGLAVRITRAATGADADARSILSVLALDVRHGDEVVLAADGDGADEVLDRLVALLTGAGADAAG
jgi:phosphocarrier protein